MTDKPTDASADRLMLLLDLAVVALHDGDDELAVLLLTEADLSVRQLLADPNGRPVRYLGVEVNDALTIAEQVDV